MPIDRGRQHEALVIVRMLADDIHATWSDRDGARRVSKRLAKPAAGALIQLMGRTQDGSPIWAKSQFSASVTFAATGSSGSVRPSRSKRQDLMPIVGRPLRSARAISER